MSSLKKVTHCANAIAEHAWGQSAPKCQHNAAPKCSSFFFCSNFNLLVHDTVPSWICCIRRSLLSTIRKSLSIRRKRSRSRTRWRPQVHGKKAPKPACCPPCSHLCLLAVAVSRRLLSCHAYASPSPALYRAAFQCVCVRAQKEGPCELHAMG